ncbi:MAG: anion permease [Veillonella sp.]
MKKLLNWIIPAVFGIGLWFIPTPEGLTPQSWHLFAIFVATIVGFITQPTDWWRIYHCNYCCGFDWYFENRRSYLWFC